MRVAIVVTTIFEPRFLDGYVENLRRFGHDETTEIIVIIDRKTPPTVAERCEHHRRAGARVLCPTLEEQESFVARFPSMKGRIPYDTDNRRNIGFLMALERGAEVLISIDDDNYVLDHVDFVAEHLVTGTTIDDPAAESSDGWLNICTLLHSSTQDEIFPRGFPYFARRHERTLRGANEGSARVAVNAGLWLSDPDVDAMTRLTQAPRIHAAEDASVRLGRGTWTPINTQNTSIVRDAIAAYYYVRMGFSLGGLRIDRYGDILSGYLVAKCVKTRGDAIRIGSPIADHRRTPHNLFKDLYHELAGMVLLDDLLPWLTETTLSGAAGFSPPSYAELYASLADALEAQSASMKGFVWDDGGRDFLVETAGHMRAWLEAVAEIG